MHVSGLVGITAMSTCQSENKDRESKSQSQSLGN